MRKFTTFLLSMILAVLALPIQAAVSPDVVIDKEYTDLASLDGGVPFAIVNKETGKALYGSTNQNLAYDVLSAAYAASNTGYYFKLDAPAEDADDESVASCHLLRLLTPAGDEYNIWGNPGYLNSQPADKDCSFILGLVNGNGQDMKNGAVWDIQYVDGKGFTLLNKATGKYLNDAAPAKYDEPVYWTFCTLKADYSTAFTPLFEEEAKIKANGTSEEANAVYDAAVADIKAALEAGTLENAEQAVTTVDEALNVLVKAQTASGSDFTRAIVNPTVDGANGWTCERPNGGNGPLLEGSSFEYWAGSANPRSEAQFDYYQEITGLANGYYTLSAEMYNSLNGETGATFEPTCGLYAQSGSTTKVQLVQEDGAALVSYDVNGVKVTDGTLRIGVKSVQPLAARWFVADNFRLAYEKALEPGEENATDEDLKPLKAELDIAKSLGVDVSAWNDKTYAVAEIAGAIQDVKVAEYAAVKANYTMDASALVPDMTEWTSDLVSNKSQHWDGTATSVYYEQKGALWSQTGWTAGASTMVSLPKGKYVIYAAGRSSANVNAYLRATDGIELEAEQTFPANGDTGKGIATNGEASFAEDATYANNGNGRGFEYRYIPFEVEDEIVGVNIAIGGTTATNHQWMSICAPVLLTTGDNANIVKSVFASEVKAAQAIVEAKAGVGDGLFQIPTEAYDTFAAAVEAAQAVIDNADATVADVQAAQQTLAEAKAAYEATPVTAPAADKQYVLSLSTSDENSPFQLSIASEKISIETAGTPVTFVAEEGGYAISNGTENIVYAGGNNWTLKASEETYAWTIAAVEGGYTITGKNGFLGTNASNGSAAGSACYGNKKSTDGFYIWTIAEYVAPEPELATIKSFEISKIQDEESAFNEDNMTYEVFVTLSADIDESVDNAVMKVKGILKSGEESKEIVSKDIPFTDIAESFATNWYLPVEYGKSYTFDVTSVSIYSVSEEEGVEPVLLTEKTYAEGEQSIAFDIPAAPEPALATIAADATVTLPEGELEVDEDGFVKATLTGKITVDESIAENAQAVLVYTLNEVNDEAEGGETEPTPEEPTAKGGGLFDKDETDEEYAMLDFDVESQEINLAVEPGKKYTLTVKGIVVNYYDDAIEDMATAAEKTFDGEDAVVIDFATASEPVLATIADDATVTMPEGELEVDENGYVHATFTGLITVDESIAEKGGAVLYYNLDEVADETDGIIKSGADISDGDEEETGDDEDAKLIKLELGVESQEILIPAEAGKKYVLTVNAVLAGNYYYDEDEQEELLNVEAAKLFVGDDALVITFATKAAPAPVLATLDFVDLATGDDAAIDEEDGTYPVVLSYGLTLDESIAAMASGSVTYTVYKGEDAVGTYTTDFDVAKEERTIYVKGLEYSTAYTVKIDKVVISYFDLETFESLVAGEFTEPTSSVSFTTNAKPEPVPGFDIAKEFTSLESLKGAVFTIVNKETGKALFGPDNQNLGYDVAEVAFAETNAGFYFKVDTLSQGTEEEAYALRMLTPEGKEYNIWGEPGYLNSQPTTGNCSFILGLNNQNGQDIKDGAVWDIQYVEGKGFTLLNKGTGKYLTSNDAAKSDEPVYWTFCTINGTKIASGIDGINAAKAADGKYIENGKVVIVKNGKKISVAGFGIK